ncbi:hypothetical protein SRHO_G00201400 [Serrasalmus rhombeus]
MFSRLHRSSLSLLPFRRIRQEPVLYSSGAPLGTFPTSLPGKKKRGTRSPSKHAGRGVLREFISEGGCKMVLSLSETLRRSLERVSCQSSGPLSPVQQSEMVLAQPRTRIALPHKDNKSQRTENAAPPHGKSCRESKLSHFSRPPTSST